MSKFLLFAISSALGAAIAAPAPGSIVYKYVANQSNFDDNFPPGGIITLNIYLSETVTSPSTSLLQATNENGLFGAGFAIKEVSSTQQPSPTTISAITANDDSPSQQFNGGAFNVATVAPGGASGTLSESTSFNNTMGVQLGNQPALAGAIMTPANDVFLGTVTLIMGASFGTTIFDLGAFGQSGTTVTYNNSDDLDNSGTDNGLTGESYTGVGNQVTQISFTIDGPEPASIGLIGMVSATGLLARRRRQN